MDEILNLIESVSEGFPSYFSSRDLLNKQKSSSYSKPGQGPWLHMTGALPGIIELFGCYATEMASQLFQAI